MTFESWCLCQYDAARRDVAALLLFLARERMAKEARARFARLWWRVEHRDDPDVSTVDQLRYEEMAARARRDNLEAKREIRQLAREEFAALFETPEEKKRKRAAAIREGIARAQARKDARRLFDGRAPNVEMN